MSKTMSKLPHKILMFSPTNSGPDKVTGTQTRLAWSGRSTRPEPSRRPVPISLTVYFSTASPGTSVVAY